jgi:hypothetical protein
MRLAARHEFRQQYTGEHNYRMLMDIYALAESRAARGEGAERRPAMQDRRVRPSA